MSSNQKAYIAGIGMITPIGANAEMTVASVKAGISSYTISDYYTDDNQPVTMSSVPKDVFKSLEDEIIEGDIHSEQYDHVIKMAIIAIKEALENITPDKLIPLILAMPEPSEQAEHILPEVLVTNIVELIGFPLIADKVQCIHTGRAAGIQAIELALRYLYDAGEEYVLIGGSDSYHSYSRLDSIGTERLKTSISMDSFVPGEGAGFVLLTRNMAKAMINNDSIIALAEPGISQEAGHLSSKELYRGEGLDQAFKITLQSYTGEPIKTVYSSMNGENYWAKEYGVAMTRNKAHFHEDVVNEHPVDCFGDLGAATASILIGVASLNLYKMTDQNQKLIYSSSDNAWRGVVRIEKTKQDLGMEAKI